MKSRTVETAANVPVRVRLLEELKRGGASGEFVRQYFLWRRELSVEDLKVVWEAAVGRAFGVAPVAI
jgi:hypothetical protein